MSRTHGGWRPALRIAGRDAGQHKLATALASLLVALPVVGAVVTATVRSSGESESENGSYQRMGGADGQLEITKYEAVTVRYRDSGTEHAVKPAEGGDTVRRDPDTVDLQSLLPEGSRLFPDERYRLVRLSAGGRVPFRVLNLDDPISHGLAELLTGSAPEVTDEVAVPPAMAGALNLLDGDGRLRSDATLIADGTRLRVVGLADTPDPNSVAIVVAPGSALSVATDAERWLVDLPELTATQLVRLRDDLAANGVSALFRDAAQHPEHWAELRSDASTAGDPQALMLGVMIVGFGALEVVVLVGAALAVGARRQIRSLGLLASTGGSPRDVRRVFLARGLLVGGGGSLLGAVVGLGGLQLALPVWDGAHGGPLTVLDVVWSNVSGTPLYVLEVVWGYVAAIVLLGTLSGVFAAGYPAWVVGRMAPIDALAGRFPTGHRPVGLRPAAVGLALWGLVGVFGSGVWISVEYASDAARERAGVEPSTLPVAAGGVALLSMMAGLVWLTPYMVERAGALSARLGLAGRIAVRDAARHRQRTSSAVVGLMVAIAGSVFAGFGVDAAVAKDIDQQQAPLDTAVIYPGGNGRQNSLGSLHDTLSRVIGADILVELRDAEVHLGDTPRDLRLVGGGEVKVVGEDFLALAGVSGAALAAYRDGAALVTQADRVDGSEVQLEAVEHRKPILNRQLPATVVATALQRWSTGAVWISPQAADALGAQEGNSTLLVHKTGGFDADDADTLSVLGIDSEGMDLSGYDSGLLNIAVITGGGLVTAVAVGILVSLAAAEGRGDAAILAAVGAPPGRRRIVGLVQGLFVGVIGGILGLSLGAAAGLSLLQAVGTPGVPVPWLHMLTTLVAVPALAAAVGWLVTPSRINLVRRPA